MAVLATPDWLYNTRDNTMDIPTNSRQRTSPANDPSSQHHQPQQQNQQQQHQQQQQQLLHQQQLLLAQQHSPAGFSYPVQQQPQGSWTPNIGAPPFYPSFYQNHQQQQQSPQPYPPHSPYFDPANAQLAAQWAYQQMMFNAQHGFPTMTPPQRPPNSAQSSSDYFPQNQIPQVFNPFPSGTPPPHAHRNDQGQQQQQQYPGYHPYRRPNRQQSQQPEAANDWRHGPHPPYARPDASGSTSSLNSSASSRQRTNSNQSGHSSGHNVPISASARVSPGSGGPNSARNTPSPAGSASSSAPSPLRQQPHHRNSSTSSSTSTSTATSARPSALSPSLPTTATSPATSSTASVTANATSTSNGTSGSATPRLTRPSPLSQGTFTASEKRMSRDDIDLGAMHSDSTPSASMIRSGGLKGRLRRALSFNAAQSLKEEEAVAEEEDDDDVSIKASQMNNGASDKLKGKASVSTIAKADGGVDDGVSATAPAQTKKKGRAASLFNSRLNASTDNISLSSTVSSASVMIRKLGAMGKLARRNSLAGITSLFKDKEKDKEKDGDKDKKGKKKDKKSAKAEASEASVSHVTAELDRMGNDWTVGTDMNGLSPAAKLARQHTLKSNAEAAAKAKEAAAAAAAREAAAASSKTVNGNGVNGAGVPTWDRNTATRQGSMSPVKAAAGVRINEDGTRTLIEEDEDESEDGHYVHHQQGSSQSSQGGFRADGWEEDDDWDGDGDGDEDVTIRVGVEPRSGSEDSRSDSGFPRPSTEMEPWAVDVRRSAERTRKPAKGILKRADSYDQQIYLPDHSTLNHRARSNSYNSPAAQSELGPLARIPSPDPDHIDGLHRHGSHSSAHGTTPTPPPDTAPPSLPPLSFDFSSPLTTTFNTTKELPSAPPAAPSNPTHSENRTSAIFQHPNFNSSAPALSTMGSAGSNHPQPPLAHRSATAPIKRLTFATNLSVYDTFSASVYDRRSEPATWSRLTPALAQRIKEELNSYKMEEMEVHAASRIHTQFFV